MLVWDKAEVTFYSIAVALEFKGQNDKDWSALTAFDEFLKDKKPNLSVWLNELVREHSGNGDFCWEGGSELFEKIPSTSKSGWVHAAIPQFHEI